MMGDRYWVSGVQLGIIKGLLEEGEMPTNIIDEEICQHQFIGRIEEWDKGDLEVGIMRRKIQLNKKKMRIINYDFD